MTEKRFRNNGSLIFDANKPLNTYDVVDLLNELNNENEQLKNEINMLRTTIARNESYIKRITETSEWSN